MLRKKIVIIDDEKDLCQLMKTYLSELDYEVHYAYTLSTGLDLLQEINPDVLFIDNNLPDGLGWDKMPFFIEKYPQCKINLISANEYSVKDVPTDNRLVRIIEKPLRLHDLREYL